MNLDANFDVLFQRFYPSLFRYCSRLTGDQDLAEDIAQEAFVRMLEKEVTGADNGIRVWLFKVATHLIRDRGRVEDNRRRLLEANPVIPSPLERPDRELQRSEEVRAVRRVLDGLDPRDRQMLLMREEGFTYREIAEAVEVASSSIGTLLVRAQKRFIKEFRDYSAIDDDD